MNCTTCSHENPESARFCNGCGAKLEAACPGADQLLQRLIGGALLRYALARIDEQGLHSYLESSNPANVPLYLRHGFNVIREFRVGGAPPVIPMLRVPR